MYEPFVLIKDCPLHPRENKAKSGMLLNQELVGVTKSSKKPFQLAEFKETKWSFINSNLSITSDLKITQDGCILEIKGDNKLVRTTAVYSSTHRDIMFAKKMVVALISHKTSCVLYLQSSYTSLNKADQNIQGEETSI
jgi:hypothetical protein